MGLDSPALEPLPTPPYTALLRKCQRLAKSTRKSAWKRGGEWKRWPWPCHLLVGPCQRPLGGPEDPRGAASSAAAAALLRTG